MEGFSAYQIISQYELDKSFSAHVALVAYFQRVSREKCEPFLKSLYLDAEALRSRSNVDLSQYQDFTEPLCPFFVKDVCVSSETSYFDSEECLSEQDSAECLASFLDGPMRPLPTITRVRLKTPDSSSDTEQITNRILSRAKEIAFNGISPLSNNDFDCQEPGFPFQDGILISEDGSQTDSAEKENTLRSYTTLYRILSKEELLENVLKVLDRSSRKTSNNFDIEEKSKILQFLSQHSWSRRKTLEAFKSLSVSQLIRLNRRFYLAGCLVAKDLQSIKEVCDRPLKIFTVLEEGKSKAQVAKLFQISEQSTTEIMNIFRTYQLLDSDTAPKRRREKAILTTKEQDKELLSLRRSGLTFPEIGEVMGVSVSAARRRHWLLMKD